MLNLKTALQSDIKKGLAHAQAVGDLPVVKKLSDIVVEHPEKTDHGDYASPFALSLSKKLKKKPFEIIEAVISHMPKKEYIGKLEGVAPGFLNIRINPGWMTARLDDVLEQPLCMSETKIKSRSINLEFISANPTGPLTLGNLRSGFSADTLANLLECAGDNVTREYYINDTGQQIKKLGNSVLYRILQSQGAKIDLPADLYQGEYIKDVAQSLAEQLRENEGREFTSDDLENAELVTELSEKAVAILQANNRKTIEDILKINFDVWTSERKLHDDGAVSAIISELRAKGITYQKDGAEWLKTTDFGDMKDEVIVKKDGNHTYFVPDIAYNRDKAQRGYDLIITFLGADHLGHVPKILAAMKALDFDTARWDFRIAQFFRLIRDGQTVKISKRAGAIATPQELFDEVGYDAARFFFLQHALSSHMDFDLTLAKERSDRNPVYYVQYAYVRLQSILRKAKEEGIIAKIGDDITLTSEAPLTHTAEVSLMRQIYRFPEVVAEIAATFEVHSLTYYVHDLARAVHVFYKHVPVLATEDSKLRQGRLQLTVAARKVLAQTFDLLGISKPDVM